MYNKKQDNKRQAYIMYMLSLLIFGTNGILVSHISLESSQIVLLRTMIGGLLLTCIVLLKGGFTKENVRKERIPLILGGVVLGMNWVALFEAYRQLNVSLATLIYYVGPIIVLLCSPLLFHEKLSGKRLLSCAIVAAGLICISGSIVITGMKPLGLISAVISALLYASLIVVNKQIIRTSRIQTAAIELIAAAIVALIYTLCTSDFPHLKRADIPYVAALGIVNTGLAYMLYFSGVQKLPGQSVALLSYLDPVSALCFSAIFLKEVMTPIQIIGAILIIGGAMIGEIRRQMTI